MKKFKWIAIVFSVLIITIILLFKFCSRPGVESVPDVFIAEEKQELEQDEKENQTELEQESKELEDIEKELDLEHQSNTNNTTDDNIERLLDKYRFLDVSETGTVPGAKRGQKKDR